jgi:hypothetical protein
MNKFIILIGFFTLVLSFSYGQESIRTFTVGNISINVPADYSYGYYDGIEDKHYTIRRFDSSGYNKVLNIMYFKKDGNFEDPDYWGYGIKNLPTLIDYINGVSEKQPQFFVNSMRRNKLKNINICETLTISRFEIFSRIFEHQIIFVDNEYCYCITIAMGGWEFSLKMLEMLPEYFNEEEKSQSIIVNNKIYYDRSWVQEKRREILNKFINHQINNYYIEELFKESNSILNTIRIVRQ